MKLFKIMEIIRNKKSNQQVNNQNIIKVVVKKYNKYTNVTRYYECLIDKKNLSVVSKMVPKSSVAEDAEEFASRFGLERKIREAIEKADNDYAGFMKQNYNFFAMEDLYSLKDMENNNNIRYSYNKYLCLMNELKAKCTNMGIISETDTENIISNILVEISNYEKEFGIQHGFSLSHDVDFCHSLDRINQEVDSEIESGNFDSVKFSYAKRCIINYYYSFLSDLPVYLELLDKKNLSDDEKKTLSKYLELFRVIPSIMRIIDHLEIASSTVEKAKLEKNKNKFKNNNLFIEKINKLLLNCDNKNEHLYIHATTSLDAAKAILNEGLYTFGDELDSFCVPLVSIEQIFEYQYGNDFSKVGDYIVVIRFSEEEKELEKLTDEDAKKMMGKLNMRRVGLIASPSYRVNPSNILGVIDKKHFNVLVNEKFKKSSVENGYTK